MKNSILYLLFAAAAFVSCEPKDDSVFEETADARLNAALAQYEKQLIEAPNGWNAVVYPGGGGSYGFHFKFSDQNRVTMFSDFTTESASTAKESSFRLKAMQQPSLIFDTYSYLHVLADPNNEVNNGIRGEGLKSDFEFSIFPDSVKTDAIVLVGRKNQTRLVLTKASEAQAVAYAKGDLAKGLLFNNIAKYQTYFKRITLAGITYEITLSQETRTIKLTWLDGSIPRTFTSNYYITSDGVVFVKPLVNGSRTIAGFSNFTWNENAVQLGMSGGGASGTVVSAIKPLSTDLAAARRWWQEPVESGSYWRSRLGFHVNGKDNAFGVDTLTTEGSPYYLYIYQPAFEGSYDLFAPTFVVNDALTLVYGHAPRRPTFTSDGRVVFAAGGTLGPVPASGPVAESSKLLYDTNGYYLVQTSETTYDMVGARDAKVWITWF